MTFQARSMQDEGPYTRPRLTAALAEICKSVGLDPRGARLLRFVNNAVFLLREHRVIVRIMLAPSLSHRAVTVVEAARWLAKHGVPAVRLLDDVAQPVYAGGHVATIWHAVPEMETTPASSQLGELLRHLHSLPSPRTLPCWRPMDDIRRKFHDTEELDPGDRAFLEQYCDDIEHRLSELRFTLPTGVVHGDAHLGNLIAGPDGPVLCDLDSMCVGPAEWDLTPLAVGHLRMGHPAERYQRFAQEYGFDVTGWSGFPVLRALRELKITVSGFPVLRSNPRIREQLHRRLRSVRQRDVTAQWTPYA
jgi:hypothetical protein